MPPTSQPQPQNQPAPPTNTPSPQPVSSSPQANPPQPTPASYNTTLLAPQVTYPQPGPYPDSSQTPYNSLPGAFRLFGLSALAVWRAIVPIIVVLVIAFVIELIYSIIRSSVVSSAIATYQTANINVAVIAMLAVYLIVLIIFTIFILPMLSFAILAAVRGVRKSLAEVLKYNFSNISRFLPISVILSTYLLLTYLLVLIGLPSVISWIGTVTSDSLTSPIGQIIGILILIPALVPFLRLSMACSTMVDDPVLTSIGAIKQSWTQSRGVVKNIFGIASVNTLIYAVYVVTALAIYIGYFSNNLLSSYSGTSLQANILFTLCNVVLVGFLVAYSASIPILYNILLSQNRSLAIPNLPPPNVMPPMPQPPASV